ncbi:unnamed protein product, partial [Didymodactylos carnosus]
MAASVNRTNPKECAACKELKEKGRGVMICAGCSQMFCNKHYPQHRQLIDKQFDQLIEQHALFQQDLNQTQHKTVSQLIQEIDEWQQEMFDEIMRAVTASKQKLTQTLSKQDEVKRKFTLITNDLRVKQSTHDYDESDVDEWKQQLAELEQQLKNVQTQKLNLNRSINFTKLIDIQVIEKTESISPPLHSPKQPLFIGGTLLNDKQHQIKLNEFCGREKEHWTLIYKGTRDGFAAKDFHRHCDGKGPTMTVIQSHGSGYLFGAHTIIPWSSQNGPKNDSEAFLFTLTNPHRHPITKFTIDDKWKQYAVLHVKTRGPILGSVHHLQ